MPTFVKYKITATTTGTETNDFYFLARENQYKDEFGAAAGVTLVTDAKEKQMPVTKVEELLKSPVASRRRVRYAKGTKQAYADVLVAAGSAATFNTDAVGKAYGGISTQVISAVIEPLKASYS